MPFELTTPAAWLSAPGTRLEGTYELRELVSADGNSALFRVLLPGDRLPRGFARLFRLNRSLRARQLDLWQALAAISHPNLVRILRAGEAQIGRELQAYVVTEGTDENLAAVLRNRSLTSDEAGELLLSIARALGQLSQAGFIHGRVCPAEIFASGSVIKLSTDCATSTREKPVAYHSAPTYLAPGEQQENHSLAADVWCLGATLFEAFTQEPFEAARFEEARKLPAPFDRILDRCLNPDPRTRPRAAEILLLYRGQDVNPQATGLPPEQLKTRRRTPLVPVLTALGLLLVAFAFWWTNYNSAQRAPATSPDAKTLTTQTSPTPPPSLPARTLTPDQPATEPAPATPSSVTPASTTQPLPETANPQIWRVILWTYSKRPTAESKVQSLTARYPEIHAELFVPDTDGSLFLVVAGGAMTTREQAEDTRRKIRQLGLPRDSYIQNFTH